MPGYSKDYFNYSYLQQYPCGEDIQLLLENGEGSFLLLPSTPMGLSDLLQISHHPNYAMLPMEGIHSRFLFGIHSGTEEKEITIDLLKYLLSYFEETGKADRSVDIFGFLPGIPIYTPILSDQLEMFYDSPYNFSPKDTESLMQLLNRFKKDGYFADAITNDTYAIFEARSSRYLTGEKSLQEAADDVYNGLMLLYHENQ